MKVFGLTGGIASGKSSVARVFQDAGLPVIDADALAREAVAPGTPLVGVLQREFPQAFTQAGELDRAALGRLVFSDAAARARLESLVHPAIAALSLERQVALAEAGHGVALYDAALLFERGIHRSLCGAVYVWAPPSVQIARLMARDGLDEAAAQARLAAQWPHDKKLPWASMVIDNSARRTDLERQARRVAQTLRRA